MKKIVYCLLMALLVFSCQQDKVTALVPMQVPSQVLTNEFIESHLPSSFRADLGKKGIHEIPLSALSARDRSRLVSMLKVKPGLVRTNAGSATAKARLGGCGSS